MVQNPFYVLLLIVVLIAVLMGIALLINYIALKYLVDYDLVFKLRRRGMR